MRIAQDFDSWLTKKRLFVYSAQNYYKCVDKSIKTQYNEVKWKRLCNKLINNNNFLGGFYK
ncbi:MAG TPA: hypothetical protein DC038_06990 [Clostridiales bacterium]|nr:hypothetical protein [Clostridiales bacterium]